MTTLICFALKEEAAPFRKIAAGKGRLKIAQPFMAGYDASKIKSPVRDGRNVLSSLTGLVKFNGRFTQP